MIKKLLERVLNFKIMNEFNGVPYYAGCVSPVDQIRVKLLSYQGGEITCTKNEGNGLASICINNPQRKNAMSGKMMVDFENIVDDLQRWKNGKAVLIYGTGDMFCSGADLNFARKENNPESGYQMAVFMSKVLCDFANLPLISAAYISGAGAIGGGAEITTACDYRLFNSNPRTGIGFVHNRMGIIPAWGSANKLVQIVGKCKALDLIITGNILKYEEAKKIELINDSVDDLQAAEDWLLSKVKFDSNVIRAAKTVIVNASSLRPEIINNELRIFANLWGGPANKIALESNIKHIK